MAAFRLYVEFVVEALQFNRIMMANDGNEKYANDTATKNIFP